MSNEPSPCDFGPLIPSATAMDNSGIFLKYFEISSANFPAGSQEISFKQVLNSQDLYNFVFMYPLGMEANSLLLSIYDESNGKLVGQIGGNTPLENNGAGFRSPAKATYTLRFSFVKPTQGCALCVIKFKPPEN